MFARVILASLLLAAPASAQHTPPAVIDGSTLPDVGTAFPDVKLPGPTKSGEWPTVGELCPRLIGTGPRVFPADAPLHTKLRTDRLNEHAAFLRRVGGERGLFNGEFTDQAVVCVTWLEAGRLAAELENTAADRVTVLREMLLGLNVEERIAAARVTAGVDPPHELNVVRVYRLSGEMELLFGTQQAAREKNPAPATPLPPVAKYDEKAAAFTAFPQLKPAGDGNEKRPGTWEPAAFDPGDSARQKLQKSRFNAGLSYVRRAGGLLFDGRMNSGDVISLAAMELRTGEARADLESTAPGKARVYEELVRRLWASERLVATHVGGGIYNRKLLHRVRAARLAGEERFLLAGGKAAGGPAPPAPDKPAVVPADFTAFPDLAIGAWGPGRVVPREDFSFPPLPAGTARRMPTGSGCVTEFPRGATAADKLTIGRLNEAMLAVCRMRARFQMGQAVDAASDHRLELFALAYRLRAASEADPGERERWYAAAVVGAKEIESLVVARGAAGAGPAVPPDLARFYRLGAELDLLDHRTPPKK